MTLLSIYAPREAPQDRVQSIGDKNATAEVARYPAPIGGLKTATNVAELENGTALVMDNFIPTTTGVQPRAGCIHHCSFNEDIKTLFFYRATGITFAASDASIFAFEHTSTTETAFNAVVAGQTSSDYSTLELQNDAGSFLTLVNGADQMQVFDGTTWRQIGSTGTPSITGVDTSTLIQGWAFQNREFFIQKNSLNAYYLGVNSVYGAATKLPLAGVFRNSSELLFGSTFSTDSGSGIDDYCAFVTKEGEVAIFSGTSPDSASTWTLRGVFTIGRPLGKRAHFIIGGDLIVATDRGLIPLSSALSKDTSQLQLYSLSANIEPDIQREITAASIFNNVRWKLFKSSRLGLAFVIPPLHGQSFEYIYGVNMETNAWFRLVGWAVEDMIDNDGVLYFADKRKVFRAFEGGQDDSKVIEHKLAMPFDNFGEAGFHKTIHKLKAGFNTVIDLDVGLSAALDGRIEFPAPPGAVGDLIPVIDPDEAATWGTAIWGVTRWP